MIFFTVDWKSTTIDGGRQKSTCASARQMMLMMEASVGVTSGQLSGGSEAFNGGNTFFAKCT